MKIIDIVKEEINQGYIRKQVHPEYSALWILNYTPVVQFSRDWAPMRKMARGLIINSETGEIVARPFPKFFNAGEHEESDIIKWVTNNEIEVTKKLDGSLGILYFIGDTAAIATRGSFTSDQAIVATMILREKYNHLIDKLDRGLTYLFEIIYPENRIVVDYGNMRDIFLLGAVERESGQILSVKDCNVGFQATPIVYRGRMTWDTYLEFCARDIENEEGYVFRAIEENVMWKYKFKTYVNQHKFVDITKLSLIKMLEENSIDDFVAEIQTWPVSIQDRIQPMVDEIISEYIKIERICREFVAMWGNLRRKEFALKLKNSNLSKYAGIVFTMLDDKDPHKIIVKHIKKQS